MQSLNDEVKDQRTQSFLGYGGGTSPEILSCVRGMGASSSFKLVLLFLAYSRSFSMQGILFEGILYKRKKSYSFEYFRI